jgi:hypothetical protein
MSIPICKNCKWSRFRSVSDERPFCETPSSRINNESKLVIGAPRAKWLCESHREMGYISALIFGVCGKRGRYFEPKDNG